MRVLRRAERSFAERAVPCASAAALLSVALLLVAAGRAASESQGAGGKKSMQLAVPPSIKVEHDELHAGLEAAIRAGGKVGEAAREVEEILHPHIAMEEEYALPQLGLLPALARGELPPEAEDAVVLSDRLKANLPWMLQEHTAVAFALEKLARAARDENKPEHALFAEKLMLHARNEEEVLYPAAVLVGEHLKLKTKKWWGASRRK